MREGRRISVIIPALNEAASIASVIADIPDFVDEVIVADNGSTDGTQKVAAARGARVVTAARRGYGSACLRGIEALTQPDIVVFLDGDYSDYPEQMDRLVDPIIRGDADLVIGSRVLGRRERDALVPQARLGNALACLLIRRIWGVRYTDLGPFRAIRYQTLDRMAMRDPNYGWTVEMQLKAAILGVRYVEAPVDYRKRIGGSKISGTIRGVLGAGFKILGLIGLEAIRKATGRGIPPRHEDHVIVFTRFPVEGTVKTRLIPAMGAAGAAELHRSMTEHVVAAAQAVQNVYVTVAFSGGGLAEMGRWLGDDQRFVEQAPGDLGARLAHAFEQAFEADRAERVVIIGSDCPEVTAGILTAALEALHEADVVLGPATDGGYYLIGLRREALERAVPHLFHGVDWGTGTVFDQTLSRLLPHSLSSRVLAPLDDVDRPEDIEVWSRAQGYGSRAAISVIIPALNEASGIAKTIEHANAADAEIIVVDGGSTDATVEIAERCGARVYTTRAGRARQMNFGAAKAAGDVLLFLHADTHLPVGYSAQVQATLVKPGVVAGAFELRLDDDGATYRFLAAAATWRARTFSTPYGDQGLFLRKETFREMGGFRELPIMEDFDFVRQLRRRGRIDIARSPWSPPHGAGNAWGPGAQPY